MTGAILRVRILHETDVVLARQRARQIAALLGLDAQDQTRFATAASEIARNAFRYAGGGSIEFFLQDDTLLARVTDQGPGIPNLREILDGRYVSPTGMGLGIIGAKRLSDRFTIDSSPGTGTSVLIGRRLPRGLPSARPTPADIADDLARRPPQSPLEEAQNQNQELLRALEALHLRQAEVERLNRELEETNRGVMALYSELDDKAESLRQASELKSRFLSNMTHELRTPLNSIIMVARQMLLQEDGPLGEEYVRQARLMLGSAEGLLELVNDLLDLAKIEAGKVEVRPARFAVADLLGALRGMFRPLQTSADVELVFDSPPPLVLFTDEGKVSQILRNLISNALKFTDRGEVRVAAADAGDGLVRLSVADTGIGISADDQHRLFEEFTQVGDDTGRLEKGTGLGLSLSRRLANLLGGHIEVRSRPGAGSTFTLAIPVVFGASRSDGGAARGPGVPAAARTAPSPQEPADA